MTRQVPGIIILTKSSRDATNPTITSATDNNHYSLIRSTNLSINFDYSLQSVKVVVCTIIICVVSLKKNYLSLFIEFISNHGQLPQFIREFVPQLVLEFIPLLVPEFILEFVSQLVPKFSREFISQLVSKFIYEFVLFMHIHILLIEHSPF